MIKNKQRAKELVKEYFSAAPKYRTKERLESWVETVLDLKDKELVEQLTLFLEEQNK